ncbi:uncharacterized protein [Henckelia pumila]|uniref:uncharacterized protein n=1 Tax=Henckelia pumila TaxID=405737 RepID=UPI003C6DDB96
MAPPQIFRHISVTAAASPPFTAVLGHGRKRSEILDAPKSDPQCVLGNIWQLIFSAQWINLVLRCTLRQPSLISSYKIFLDILCHLRLVEQVARWLFDGNYKILPIRCSL